MTRALPFTQAALRRAIAAAQKTGMRVKLMPDGSIAFVEPGEVQDGAIVSLAPEGQAGGPSRWEDVEA